MDEINQLALNLSYYTFLCQYNQATCDKIPGFLLVRASSFYGNRHLVSGTEVESVTAVQSHLHTTARNVLTLVAYFAPAPAITVAGTDEADARL